MSEGQLGTGFGLSEKECSRVGSPSSFRALLAIGTEPVTAQTLKGVTTPQELADCDIVIEAIIENVDEKKKMFAGLDAIVKKDAIFATNTSSISVTEVAAATKRAGALYRPALLQSRAADEAGGSGAHHRHRDAAFETAYEFGKSLGKVPVRTSDKTGFIVNRLLVPYMLDAIRAYEEGVGSIDDIDNAMKLGCGYPMGPFTLLDFVGPRHHLLHHARDVRRVQGAPLCLAAAAEAAGDGGLVRTQDGQGVLRLRGPGESRAAKKF